MAGLQAEKLGDIEQGEAAAVGEVDDLGLTSEERQQFDSMKDADKGLPEAPESEEPEPAADTPAGVDKPTLDAPPAPAEAKKAPAEPEEDDEPDQLVTDPRTGKQQRTISFGKHQRLLKKAREDAEALRTANEETKINQAKLAERLTILNEALTTPVAPQPRTAEEEEYYRQQEVAQNPLLEDTIDPNIDLAGSIAQLQRRQVFMAHTTLAQQETTQEVLADQALVRDFTRDTQLYSQTAEGQHFFGAEGAYQYLKNSRLVELGISLFDKDPSDPKEQFTQAEIDKMISDFNTEEKWVVNNALQSGKSPAKAIMRLAKGRGWKAPSQQQAAAAPAAAAQAPAARRGAPAAPAAARSAVAQLQAEQAGAAASRSLSDGGGAPPAEPLSIEKLLKMDDEEFGAYVDNLPPAKLQALMGREFPGRG
jgi:hypothetical protein